MIEVGHAVVIYLREPREQYWGVLRRLDVVGVSLEGCDVAIFDTWLARVEAGLGNGELSVYFFPTRRIEKVLLDRGLPGVPSCGERFENAVGETPTAWLNAGQGSA